MQILFSVLCFISSFLFFTGEFLYSELLLPFFGGSAHVWITCVFFYAFVLLLGYLFVYLLNRLDGILACLLLLVILLLQLFTFNFDVVIIDKVHPINGLLFSLNKIAFFPMLLLSMATPLLQSIADRHIEQKQKILLVSSNIGSLAGLIFYPLVGSTFFGLIQKKMFWQTSTIFCSLIIFVMAVKYLYKQKITKQDDVLLKFSTMMKMKWFFFSFLTCFFMLAVTNFTTNGLGSVPLLWMIPLAI